MVFCVAVYYRVCCNVLQHTATDCNTWCFVLQCTPECVAMCCSTLQQIAIHGVLCCSVLQSVLQCVAAHCNRLQYTLVPATQNPILQCVATHCILQCVTTHCNRLQITLVPATQNTATQNPILHNRADWHCKVVYCVAEFFEVLQCLTNSMTHTGIHSRIHCNTKHHSIQ